MIAPIELGPDVEEAVHPIVDDEIAFFRAIMASPADSAPWLVYADWLEERGFVDQACMARQFWDTNAPGALVAYLHDRAPAPANIRRQTGTL